MEKLIVIEGTNASGKSGLGVRLASALNGEIVSADSRQVFKGYDLGSGKITQEEMNGVPHHMLDICESGDFFSMHDFQRIAYREIDDILSRGRVPFLVGGTGLYVSSVTDGYVMSDRAPDLEYRNELEKLSTPQLGEMLRAADPDIEVDWKNRNRVMRILEKIHDGDDHIPQKAPRYECLKIGVSWPREILKQRIDERLERRMRQGMVDEVRGLLQAGATVEFMKKLGLEYRFITEYITGEIPTEEEMTEQLALAIKRFAKRQMIWFRRDKEIHWLDMSGDPYAQAMTLIEGFLNSANS